MKKTAIIANVVVILALCTVFGVTYRSQAEEISRLKMLLQPSRQEVRGETLVDTEIRNEAPVRTKPSNNTVPVPDPAAVPKPTAVLTQYSPFVLAYSCSNEGGKGSDPCTGPRVRFGFNMTAGGRDIVIRKAVVSASGLKPGDVLYYSSSTAPTSSGTKSVSAKKMSQSGSEWTYSFVRQPVGSQVTDEMPLSVEIDSPGVLDGNDAVIVPEFDKWQVWDNTSDQPVRIVKAQ